MTYDLINNNGEVEYSNYSYAKALSELKWRSQLGGQPLKIVPHGQSRRKPKVNSRSFQFTQPRKAKSVQQKGYTR